MYILKFYIIKGDGFMIFRIPIGECLEKLQKAVENLKKGLSPENLRAAVFWRESFP